MTCIPKIIFIIPYRNRYFQKIHFDVYMKYIMEDYNKNDYEIYYSHQCDKRQFNRGALKNIGFIAMKNKYPNDYKNITFVFNDIDTLPYKKNFLNYETTKGKIKHFYGFEYALGGIVSVNGDDFEKMNGFPNFWGWGLEDNMLKKRADYYKINIDRSNFVSFYNNVEILHFDNSPKKIVTNNPISIANNKNVFIHNGLKSLININYVIQNDYININSFDDIILKYNTQKFIEKDCSITNKMKDENRYGGIMKMNLGIGQKR